jgi:glycosyltransferase involved in cell wall biosynthesis
VCKTSVAEVKVAWNVRSAMQNPGAENRLLRAALTFSRWCHPDLTIYNSYAGQSIHQNLGIQRGRQVMIPNGINLSEYQFNPGARAAQRQHHRVSDEVWVGVVGRMHPAKGIREYLLAVKALQARGVAARFFLAGAEMTSAHTEFCDLLRDTGVSTSALDLLGPIDNVADFLSAVDLLVVPSLREGTPNILLEAMACGVNTVATDVGDVARIVRDPGRLAAPGRVDDLVKVIFDALEVSEEKSQQRRASEATFMLQNYDAPLCMQAYCDHYEDLFKRPADA